jgi:hypothetical protein
MKTTPGPNSAWSFHAEITTVSCERRRLRDSEEEGLPFFILPSSPPPPFPLLLLHSSTAASAAATTFFRTRSVSFRCGSAALRKHPAIAGRPSEAKTGTGRADATPASRELAAASSRAAAADEASTAEIRSFLDSEVLCLRARAARGRSSFDRGSSEPS